MALRSALDPILMPFFRGTTMRDRTRCGAFALGLIGLNARGAKQVTVEGRGGGGESSSASNMGSGGGSDAGLPGACSVSADCSRMNDACNIGVCVNGICVK